MDAIVRVDASELGRLISSREVSCREVMLAFLDRIHHANPAVNAIVALRAPQALLAEADARDPAISRGDATGPLHGFPIAVKDLAMTAGIRSTLGSPIFKDHVPSVDALMVQRMKAAGAIIIGKTNTPEFGLGSQSYNPVYGVTRNPYDLQCCAGGSSGGAAAALALRMLPVADGSDMGGSLRNPAAFNNVFGFRPSFGRVPKWPEVDVFLQQLGVEGPMARSVDDLARLLAVQAGYDPRAPLSLAESPDDFAAPLRPPGRGLRIGWLGDLDGYLPYEPGIVALCREALEALEAIGCAIFDASLGFDPERLWKAWLTLRSCTAGASLHAHYQHPERRALLKPEAIWEVEHALACSALDVYRASVTRTDWHRALLALFERFDILALPSAQVFPFDAELPWPREIDGRPMDTYHRWMEVVVPATMGGCPTISVPVGFGGPRGLPMGMQLIGAPRDDLRVLQVAAAYDQMTQWVRRCPPPEPGL